MYVPTSAEAADLIPTRPPELMTVDGEFGCWLWVDTPESFGPVLAFYEAAYGPLAEGMKIGHACPNGRRGCVRPAHLDCFPEDMEIPEPPLRNDERAAFAQILVDERDARRYTRAEMARHLRVAEATLKAWEDGERVPAPDVARQVGRKLGWGNKPRKWTVTVVHQRVFVAVSAGQAVRAMWDELAVEGEQLKTEVADVRKA